MMPVCGPEQRLQGVVIRSSLALNLVNHPVVGEPVEVRPCCLLIAVRSNTNRNIATSQGGLVDVAYVKQMAGVGPDVTNLCDDIGAETLLDIQVVAIGIGRPEFLVHGKKVGDSGACNRIRQRSEDKLAWAPDRYPWQGIRTGHWVYPTWIVLNPKRAAVHCTAQIQEGHDVGRLVEQSKAAA